VTLAPLRSTGGYLPLEDYGLIGDGAAAALVGRDGSVSWLCAPRFDSPPLFCRLLDSTRGGGFLVAPEGLQASCQYYEADTALLVTEMQSETGRVRLTDALVLRSGADLTEDIAAGRGELVRCAEVLAGRVRLRIEVDPWGGGEAEAHAGGLRIHCQRQPGLDLHLSATVPLDGLRTAVDLVAGDRVYLTLGWNGGGYHRLRKAHEERVEATRDAWRRWMQHVAYQGPQEKLVRRSAITLKLLDHFESGAIVASPTSSLPEAIGGPRNWDYRYAWIRDAAFSVYALHRIGLSLEATGFLGWVLNIVEKGARPKALYSIDGTSPPPEREDDGLEGYRRSWPVRWGNAAAEQVQNDAYGEIIDCAYQWAAHFGRITEPLWNRLQGLAAAAQRDWRSPDHGIWEVRTHGRPFTYSAALCHVALDRAAKLAERFQLPGDVAGWRSTAEQIRAAILSEAWDEQAGTLTEHLGGGAPDASLLALPLRRVLPADDPRMVATTATIMRRLDAGNGLLYRYLPDESPDGLPGREGAFVLCSFWLVDNLAKQGRVDEAMALYDSLCARAGNLGLIPEQIDPASGAFLGNYPQAFSHIGLISSGVNLARTLARLRAG
jgi:GH15 family glucan-1,4-alpha-glucosidase